MATKKSRHSNKKPANSKSAKAKVDEVVDNLKDTKDEVVEATVEATKNVAEKAEEVTKDVKAKIDDKKAKHVKVSLIDKLAALNPIALIAEMVGTFALAAAVIQLATNNNFGTIATALIFAILVVIFGAISGAHLNPAISIAKWIGQKIDGVKCVGYIIAQILGATLAFFALTAILNANFDYHAAIKKGVIAAGVKEADIANAGGLEKWATNYGGIDKVAEQLRVEKTAPKPYHIDKLTEGKEWVALACEILGSFIFGLGVAYASFNTRKNSLTNGLTIGVALLAGLAIGGTTTVLNPAVAAAIGAFQISTMASFVWSVVVYAFGSAIGMTAGFMLYRLMVKNVKSDEIKV